jgi:hypothetical protein
MKSIKALLTNSFAGFYNQKTSAKMLLGIGYVNRADLLYQAVNSVDCLWENTVVIDNSQDGHLRDDGYLNNCVTVYTPPIPLTFTQTMNLLHRMAAEYNCDAVLYMHNDAEAEAGTPNGLVKMINQLQENGVRWGAVLTNWNTLAAYNMAAVREVGPWDTVFPHYLADHDYYRRLRLAGYAIIETGLPVYHHNGGGSTLKADAHLNEMNNLTFYLYEQYYQAKWGGGAGGEQYGLLFNEFPLNPLPQYLAFIDPAITVLQQPTR